MKLFNERGYIFIAFAFLLPLFVLLLSLGWDFGWSLSRKAVLQNIADAAVLAGAMNIENQNEFHLVSGYPEEGEEESIQDIDVDAVNAATNKSIQSNVEHSRNKKNVEKIEKIEKIEYELKKINSDYYYRVKISAHVPLWFLPKNFMPDGLPVSVIAWAKAEYTGTDDGSLFNQAYNIGWNQTAKLMAEVRDHGGGNNRAEKIGGNEGIHYNYSKDADGNVTMSRTETVDTRDVKTWKYMYVDFQPDIVMDVKQGVLIDGQWNFPFTHWDGLSALSESDFARFKYNNIFNLDGNSGRSSMTRTNLINKLMSTYGMSKDEAIQMLITPVENVVLFNDLHKVRGYTVEELAAWEEKKMKETGWVVKGEKDLAEYLGNDLLAQLVARNVKGEIAATDPLLVRIESEDMTRLHSYSNENIFYASSVRTLTLKNNINNMDKSNRPLIIYYFGPQDSDEEVNAGRTSLPVTFELNADFKGILFAPYSPVIVKGNGHKIKGLVIGKYFIYNGEKISPYASHMYSKLGFYESNVEFDDFELFDIPSGIRDDDHVFMTSDKSKQIK